MKLVQLRRKKDTEWKYLSKKEKLNNPLVLVFGNRYLLEDENVFAEVKTIFPDGHIVFGSTSGNIISNTVKEEHICITAIEFERSTFIIKTNNILDKHANSYETGNELIKQLPQENLKYVLLISEGSFVNGSELAKGVRSVTKDVLVTGGLCGDGERFEKTICSYNENPKEGEIIAVGLYGDTLEATFSIHGGWIPFGPERIVTRSEGNVLYEVDGQPALELYKKYLGEKAKDLPASGLLYPLNVKAKNDDNHAVVRSILKINEEDNSIILAGDIPNKSTVQFMMTNIDKIVEASELAAIRASNKRIKKPELALLVSCIGRKMVLHQRVEDEIEEIIETIGGDVSVFGFYSYGELAPFNGEGECRLHNQTMAVTLLSE